ncbi:MAG: hypothetical protein KAR35_07700 [Candidatus Heimdallarchaeota archaeon]|nr:hypothetical protein [Candidatus Heimdallarchaeota archaeon]MCK5049243.1 hypothetical protein [Candidatus Heimdallarchaeota archaeon]
MLGVHSTTIRRWDKEGKISEMIITYKDRLTRFGFEYLEDYFTKFAQ